MDLPCGVIRDLLILYVDDLAGTDSQAAVEAHLKGCAACREHLHLLRGGPRQADPAAEAAAVARTVEQVGQRLSKDLSRWMTVIKLASILVGVMVALAAAFATNPFQLILVLPLAGLLGGWLFKNLWQTPLVVAAVTMVVVASQGSDGLLAGRLIGGAVYGTVGALLTLTGGVIGWLFKFALHKEPSS